MRWLRTDKAWNPSWLRRFSTASDPRLREKAALALGKIVKKFSREEVERLMSGFLGDSHDKVRKAALENLPTLGERAPLLLRDALIGAGGGQLLSSLLDLAPEAMLFDDEETIAKLLIGLVAERPEFAPSVLQILKTTSHGNPAAEAFAASAVNSNSKEARHAAADAILSWNTDLTKLPAGTLTALQEAEVARRFRSKLEDTVRVLRIGLRPVRTTIARKQGDDGLPEFPWPPPAWSDNIVIPKSMFGGPDATLGEVHRQLSDALSAANPDYRWGLFGAVPGGYALLARVERIEPDGRRLDGFDGWTEEDKPISGIREFIIQLLMSPPGYYRVIAFVITSQVDFRPGDGKLPRERAGAKMLPPSIANMRMDDRECFALIYTYRRYPGGRIESGFDRDPGGRTHLMQAGIWTALTRSEPTSTRRP